MSTYELQIHSRYLDLTPIPPAVGIARHTGYDLIEKNADGKIISIRSIDLAEKNGEIHMVFVDSKTPIEITVDGKKQIWPSKIYMGSNINELPNFTVTQDEAERYDFRTATINIGNPKAVFDWIVFDATFRNAFSQIDGGLIDYDIEGPNCNTWTNHIAQTYLNGTDVFSLLGGGIYPGKNNDFTTGNTSEDNRNCAILEEISQKFFNKYSNNFNFDKLKITLTNAKDTDKTTTINGFYAEITDGRKNYIFDSDEGNIITGNSKDNYIIAGKGNDEINAGAGDDIVDAGIWENEKGINKYANLGSGDDIYLGGMANDQVNGGNGTNRIMLGAGSDEYHGGSGVDIVDGGSGRNIIFSGIKNIIDKENISGNIITDSIFDINDIDLGGGADIYYGGAGKDIVEGGSGNDKIYAGDGNNEINGGTGHDIIKVGNGKVDSNELITLEQANIIMAA